MEHFWQSMLGWLDGVLDVLSGIVDVVGSVDPAVRALAGGIAAFLEVNVVTGFVVPGDTVIVAVASAVATPVEALIVGLAAGIGSTLGQLVGFAIGRWAGSGVRGERLRSRLRSGRWSRVSAAVERYGGPLVLASRFLPLFRTVVPFVVGGTGMSVGRFVSWAAPGSFAWAGVSVVVYALAASSLRPGSGSAVIAAAFAFIGLILYVGSVLVQRSLGRGPAETRDGPSPNGGRDATETI